MASFRKYKGETEKERERKEKACLLYTVYHFITMVV